MICEPDQCMHTETLGEERCIEQTQSCEGNVGAKTYTGYVCK